MSLSKERRICQGCKSPAHIFDKYWWCGIDRETARGACKKNKLKHNIPSGELNDVYRRLIK